VCRNYARRCRERLRRATKLHPIATSAIKAVAADPPMAEAGTAVEPISLGATDCVALQLPAEPFAE
jgi:hypothetical protein